MGRKKKGCPSLCRMDINSKGKKNQFGPGCYQSMTEKQMEREQKVFVGVIEKVPQRSYLSFLRGTLVIIFLDKLMRSGYC